MSVIALTVNGRAHSLDVDPATPLLYVLNDDLALNGPKFGCGLGQCGACAVIVDGRAIRSCVTPVGTMNGVEVTTLEGLGTVERPHPLQQAFIDRNPSPSDAQIQQAMSTVLCRCFAHTRMLRAIARYAKEKKA